MSNLSTACADIRLLNEGWSLVLTDPGAYSRPGDLKTIPAIVPGTVAAALEAAGKFDRNEPMPLTDRDAWYRLSLRGEKPGDVVLRFEGLATIAEIFLNGELLLTSGSMFEAHDVAVELSGDDELTICFRALKPHLEKSGPRARWRPRLMNNQGLRLIRTTTLGFMPGWCPEIHAVGPWRPITLIRASAHRISDLSISAKLTNTGGGLIAVAFHYDGRGRELRLACNGHEALIEKIDGTHSATLSIPAVKPWWPHTHGEPNLHDVSLSIDGERFPLARTGFRSIVIDRGEDGEDFGVVVNGEKIFCRGALWTSADLVGMSGSRETYEPWLRLAHEAGMNMIRIPGIAAYESQALFDLCDELGLLVWQDFMFANFDYPANDPDFMDDVKSEIGHFLATTQSNPSLVVLCGGSEIYQQGAMMGLTERIWKGRLCEEILPAIANDCRPDLPYVTNSPSGGALPFFPNAGVAHYYGVGAYKRPLDDARHANIRFAAECLAFSNLSASETLAAGKTGIPRDAGADWDFEDVRDHYLGELYETDPQQLRTDDFERYLALSRATTGEVMEEIFAEWRRSRSSCNGALVLALQDVMPGPGWGVIDVAGQPKPAWNALKRAFRPVQVSFSDEGTNGLDIHLLNETAMSQSLVLELACLRDGRIPVVSGSREMTLTPRADLTIASTDLFGAFFDTNYAYRFGPASHDLTVARLTNAETGNLVAEAFHFPIGRAKSFHNATIDAQLGADDAGNWLELSTDVFAQSVTIEAQGFRAADNGFHLAPGFVRRIRLIAVDMSGKVPSGTVASLGSDLLARF